jgi:CRP/FNR family transcriptional regulator, nitrogen oxide reductase regulator
MTDLPSSKLFAALGKDEIGAVVARAFKRKFKASENVIMARRPAANLVLVLTGSVNFYILSETGRNILLHRCEPGDVFGIAALLSEPAGYLGTATAVHQVEILGWEGRVARHLARTYPRFAENALRIALHYFAEHARRHVSLVSDKAQERLAYALTNVASSGGRVLQGGVEIRIKNEDLASLADVSLFTASRILQKWERMGALEKSRGKALIRCPEKLLVDESESCE